MFRTSFLVSVLVAALLVLGGCVPKSDFLRKQAEADILSRDMASLSTENSDLRKTIGMLQEKVRGLQNEIARLQSTQDNIAAERSSLNVRLDGLKAQTNRTIEELRNRSAELEGDKQMLGESIVLLKKSKDELTDLNIALEAEKQVLRENIEQMRRSHEELKSRNAQLESERQALEENVGQLTLSRDELSRKNIDLEGEKQALEEGMAELRASQEEEIEKGNSAYEELHAALKNEFDEGQLSIADLPGGLTIDIPDRMLFASGHADLKREGLTLLKRVAATLKTLSGKRIRVEGHTDNVPIKGALSKRFPTNWELSAARALSVTRCLEQEGVAPTLLSAAAFGEHQPATGNETPEGRSRNRRISIVLVPAD